MKPLTALMFVAAWLAFAGIAPRVFPTEWTALLALAGMGVTIVLLALTGRILKSDPLSLNLTGRRPYWEMR
ncbi:MAG: hypothetical protein AAFX09_02805 [Pseudomonadota bacterium]